jgi:basic membrane protein A
LDSSAAAPDAFLTAPIWHHEEFLVPAIEKIINGTWKPESYYGTVADGYVDLAPLTDLVPDETRNKMEQIKIMMESGEFSVFRGPIWDSSGALRVMEGEVLGREEIWNIDYLVEGVEGA